MVEIKDSIDSNVKDIQLINIKRQNIIDASVKLFIKKGFHKTTVREISKESGISMGSLYDYIRTKEDILFLVCDHIHNTVSEKLKQSISNKKNSLNNLKNAIREYFLLINDNQNHMLLLYQETKALNKKARKYIFNAEKELIEIFYDLLMECIKDKSVKIKKNKAYIAANNIMVLGHMWAFRRWTLSKRINIEEYIKLQTNLILKGMV